MATKSPYRTTYTPEHVIQPLYTGGSVSLDKEFRILATSLGEDVVFTDLATGTRLAKIEGDDEVVSALALTPDGKFLVVCSRSLSMRIYGLQHQDVGEDDGPSGAAKAIETTLLRTLKPHSTPVVALANDQSSTLVATGAADGSIKMFDIKGGYVTHTLRGPSVLVSALQFFSVSRGDITSTKRGKKGKRKEELDGVAVNGTNGENDSITRLRLAVGAQDGKIRIWDLHKRAIVANLDSHASDVTAIDYSPERHELVTSSRDKTLVWWDASSWAQRKTVPTFEQLEASGFLDGGRLTYTAGERGYVRLWHAESGREVSATQETRTEEEAIFAAQICGDRPQLLCVQSDHTLVLYKTPSSMDSATTEIPALPQIQRISGTHDDIIDLAYMLPDHSLMALATNSEDVRIVSVGESASSHFGQDVALLKGHEDIVIALDVDWSGHWIVTAAKDNTAKLWRVDQEQVKHECWASFVGHAESVGAVALPKKVPDESTAAFKDPLNNPPAYLVTGSQDQTVKKWELPRERPEKGQRSARAAFTRKAHDKDINALDISCHGQIFASASQDKTVKIWSVAEGEVQGILRGHRRGVWSVRFAPANTPSVKTANSEVAGKNMILTGSGDKTVKIWNLNDYTCIRTCEGHSNSILKVAWLATAPQTADEPDKDKSRRVQVASAGGDGLVKVWDANSGEADCTLDNHEDRVWALTVHPITNMIVSGSADSTVTFWKDTSTETRAAAVQEATKLIEQEQQLENYMHAGSYRDAITLALQLNHPGRLLNLFTSVVTSQKPEPGSLCGSKAVDTVLRNLSDDQLFLLLLRLRDWNTNARAAPVAQRILSAIVKLYPADKVSNLSVKGARGQRSLQEVLNALKAYTERHLARLEELIDESFLVEYTLQRMSQFGID